MENFPTGGAYSCCVADVARHESTDENPAITLQPSPARQVPAATAQ